MNPRHVIVVGAGIVGVSCALWIQRNGHQVTLVDHSEPGSGTSFGNACTIADYACIPVNSPALIWSLPRLLFAKQSPLSIDIGYAISNIGWSLSLLNHCRPSKVRHSVNALASLLASTFEGLDSLVSDTQSEHLFSRKGCLYIYKTRQAYEAAFTSNKSRKDHGVKFDTITGDDIQQLEPSISSRFYGGLLYTDARQTVNPKSLIDRYFNHFVTHGGKFVQAKVKALATTGCAVVLEDDRQVSGDKVIIAAGAFSGTIGNAGIESLPLDTERGYHVQFEGRQALLKRPVGWAEAGLYATPTDSGLRFAGTVEIAGLAKPANQLKLDYLTTKAREMFQLEENPQQTWLGFRPTMPDALPVIGYSPHSRDILYAFGHQHIGLTLGGITGKLIAELISDQPTCVNIEAFSPSRF